MNFRDELDTMRRSYARRPLWHIRLGRPTWMTDSDPMSAVYREKGKLLRDGKVCWAHIVQANEILFRDLPPLDCPAQIIYSLDESLDAQPEILRQVAYELYSYKGKPPEQVPPAWREVARVITDEMDRTGFRFSLEWEGRPVEFFMIPTMIFRKLLPGGRLQGSYLPILTSADCSSVLVLPKAYWSEEFRRRWESGGL